MVRQSFCLIFIELIGLFVIKYKKRHGFMQIQLNGEGVQVVAVDLAGLVTELGLEKRMIAIERNMEVVPKSEYAATQLEENDRIELVHMIGGG